MVILRPGRLLLRKAVKGNIEKRFWFFIKRVKNARCLHSGQYEMIVLLKYTLYRFGAVYNFQSQSRPLVGKTTKHQTEIQYSCGMRSLISIIIILWLLCLSPNYTSFQHFNVSVREICHCVHPQNGVMLFHNSNSDKNGAPLQGAAIIMHSLLKPHQNMYATFTLPPKPRCLPPYPYRLMSVCHGFVFVAFIRMPNSARTLLPGSY